MKIGLVTIFNVPNYGAMLQTYALSEYLHNLGHEIVLIEIPFYDKTRNIIWRLKQKYFPSFKWKFVNNNLPAYTKQIDISVDIYMVGSDQVWNPEIVGDKLYSYMLDFAPIDAIRVSYASSFGIESWNYAQKYPKVRELLSRFQQITVRESSGVKILAENFNLTSQCVLDPCLLLNDYLSRLSISKEKFDTNCLVSYKLQFSQRWIFFIKQLASSLNCSWCELHNRRRIEKIRPLFELNMITYSVQDWIGRIATARYVITDSFHGTVFSLIYERQFVVINSIKNRITRVNSLLDKLGLLDRIIEDESQAWKILSCNIDYSIITPKLNKLIAESKYVLNHILSIKNENIVL